MIKAKPKAPSAAAAATAAAAAAAVPGSLASIMADASGDQRRMQLAQYTSCKICGAPVALRDVVRCAL